MRVSGLDLHSGSAEPINFFGAQSSLGGAQLLIGGTQAVIWGARPRMPPRGAGPDSKASEIASRCIAQLRQSANRSLPGSHSNGLSVALSQNVIIPRFVRVCTLEQFKEITCAMHGNKDQTD